MSVTSRLYAGTLSYDFIGRRKLWYTLAAALTLICIAALLFLRLNLGIEFKGGTVFQFPAAASVSQEAVREVAVAAGAEGEAIVQRVGGDEVRLQTGPLPPGAEQQLADRIESEFGVADGGVTVSTVGASWGRDISNQALKGLLAFLVAVTIYISLRFEPKMAIASLVALVHDLIITAGIYSIVGFEVTPATVIAILTILGYSLYDTVVVFDKVDENTSGILGTARQTYGEAANLAINQTVVRSINTSLIALLPVAALLFIGAGVLQAGTLKDLALALFVGIAAGTYSSIFLATPLLVDLKERDPKYKALTARVLARRSGAPSTRAAGRRAGSTAAAQAPAVAPAASSTAVLEREDPADSVDSVDRTTDEVPAATASGRPAGRAGARPRPAGGSTRRNVGKHGRPGGKRRR